MSQAIPTSVTVAGQETAPDVEQTAHARSLVVGSRLLLAANVAFQASLLFAYLYLHANNFGGAWRNGVQPPAVSTNTIVMLIPVLTTGIFWMALGAARTGRRQPVTMALGLAVLGALATIAIRVYQLYNTGWSLDGGAYIDMSVMWFVALLAEFIIGALIGVSLLMGHLRDTVPATAAQLRALFGYWAFVTGVGVVVYLLVQFVA